MVTLKCQEMTGQISLHQYCQNIEDIQGRRTSVRAVYLDNSMERVKQHCSGHITAIRRYGTFLQSC